MIYLKAKEIAPRTERILNEVLGEGQEINDIGRALWKYTWCLLAEDPEGVESAYKRLETIVSDSTKLAAWKSLIDGKVNETLGILEETTLADMTLHVVNRLDADGLMSAADRSKLAREARTFLETTDQTLPAAERITLAFTTLRKKDFQF